MATEYADSHTTEMARKKLAGEKDASDRMRADAFQQLKGKPTPTQEENDLSACGAHILMHDDDGSLGPLVTRHMEAEKPAGTYQTRQVKPEARPEVKPEAKPGQRPATD